MPDLDGERLRRLQERRDAGAALAARGEVGRQARSAARWPAAPAARRPGRRSGRSRSRSRRGRAPARACGSCRSRRPRPSASTSGLSPAPFRAGSTAAASMSSAHRSVPCTWLAQRKLSGSCSRREARSSSSDAAAQELAQAGRLPLLARGGVGAGDVGVDRRRRRAEALHRERRRDLDGVQQAVARVDGERGDPGRDRRRVAEREPVAGADRRRGRCRPGAAPRRPACARRRPRPRPRRAPRARRGRAGTGRRRRSIPCAGRSGARSAFSMAARVSATAGETPAPPAQRPFRRASSVARTAAAGSGSPTAVARPRTIRAACSPACSGAHRLAHARAEARRQPVDRPALGQRALERARARLHALAGRRRDLDRAAAQGDVGHVGGRRACAR